MMESARSLPYLADAASKDLYRYQVWKAPDRPFCHLDSFASKPGEKFTSSLRTTTPRTSGPIPQQDGDGVGVRYVSFLCRMAHATIATFGWLRVISSVNQQFNPGA